MDHGAHVEIAVFAEPDVATARHRAGLRRLVALQLREPLRYLEKSIPDLQRMAAAFMPLGTLEELRGQIVEYLLASARAKRRKSEAPTKPAILIDALEPV